MKFFFRKRIYMTHLRYIYCIEARFVEHDIINPSSRLIHYVYELLGNDGSRTGLICHMCDHTVIISFSRVDAFASQTILPQKQATACYQPTNAFFVSVDPHSSFSSPHSSRFPLGTAALPFTYSCIIYHNPPACGSSCS